MHRPKMDIYLVRSGSDAGTHAGKLSDERLTIEGQSQARAVAKYMAKINITTFLVSPAMRALETAEIIAHEIKTSFQIEKLLADRDLGKATDMTYSAVEKKFGKILSLSRFGKDWKFPEGETNAEVYERAKRLMVKMNKGATGKMEKILIVSHPLVMNYLIYNLQDIGFQEGLLFNFQPGMIAHLQLQNELFTTMSLFEP